jgi:GAF domain-containing protein
LTHQLSATSSEKDAARLLERACRELFDFDAFLLDAYDPGWDLVHNVLALDVIEGERKEVPPAFTGQTPGPIGRKVILEGPQLILRKPGSIEDDRLQPFGDKGKRSLSLMFAPLRNGDLILGTLSVQSYKANAYMQSDLDLLQVTADLCGGAFDRIRTEAELHAKGFRHLAARDAGLELARGTVGKCE